MNLKLNIIILFLFIGSIQLYAQETKEEIEIQANALFKKEQFIEATPLFLRLLSLEPRDPSYNYKYGTCLLFNSEEKNSAFKYLNYAVQKSTQVDIEAYYYLGKAYHLTFQFDEAIKYYKIYKEMAGTRAVAKLNVDLQIQMCRNGKSLLADINEVIVLNKTKIDKKNFFRIYNLKDIGGEILVTAEFQTKTDKKNDHTPIIHFPANSDHVYYSSYGESDNKNIYVRTRLPGGKWSLAQPISGEVNTPFDEDYPYMDPQNRYLYFSSKGHNSMGGYDIFRSHFNPETNSFGKPENMDIPISSPDNDFLYMVDSLERHAYFASQRESESDKIDVYEIRVERIPVNWIILKGQFESILNPSEKALSISVNNNSGALIGNFRTSRNGDYLIVLPKGGKYEFTMKVGNESKEYKQFIEVPFLDEIKPLRQKIIQTTKEGNTIVVVKNLFDEPFENESAIIAQALELKSKLMVNKQQYDLDSLDLLREEKIALDKVGLSGFTNIEILDLAQNKMDQLSDRNETSKVLIDKAKSRLVKGNEEVENHLNKADKLLGQAKSNDNKKAIEEITRQAQKEIQSAKEIQNELQMTKDILDSLVADKERNEQRLNQAKQLNNDLKNVDAKDENAIAAVLGQHQDFVNNELLKETNSNAAKDYMAQLDKQMGNQAELIEKQNKLKEERIKIQKEVDRLTEEHKNAKGKKQKDLSLELAQAENQLESINSELNYVNGQLKKQEEITSKRKWIARIEVGDIIEGLPDNKEIEQKSNTLKDRRSNVETENYVFAAENGIDLTKEPTAEPKESTEEEIVVLNSDELLVKADPEYEKDIEDLNAAVETGDKSKDDIVKRVRRAIIQIDDITSEMMSKRVSSPNKKQIDENIEKLTELKDQLNQKIEKLNQEIEVENALANVPEDNQEIDNEENSNIPDKNKEENAIDGSDSTSPPDKNQTNNQRQNQVEEHQPRNEEHKDPVDEQQTAKESQESADAEENIQEGLTENIDSKNKERQPKKEKPKTEVKEPALPEIETPNQNKSTFNAATDQQKEKIKELNEMKSQLIVAEKENPSLADNSQHQKEIAKVEEQIVQQENEVLESAIESFKSSSASNKTAKKEKEPANVSLLNAQHSKIEIDDLIREASEEKDPKKQRELLKSASLKQEESIAKIQEQQNNERVDRQIDSIISSNNYQNINPENVTVTVDDIRKEQNDIEIKLLEIKNQVNEISALIPSAKKKDKENLTQQKKQLEELQVNFGKQQRLNQEQLSKFDQEKIVINNIGVDVDAINNELSYEDEVEIAQSENYKELFTSSNRLRQLQFELQVKEEQLKSEKDELKQLRAMKGDHIPLTSEDKKGIENQLTRINKTEGEIIDLKNEILAQQNNIKSFIAEDIDQQEKIENMIARDVAPISEIPSLPVMMSGLITTSDPRTQYSDKNPIPLSVEQPKGLVFRVQIGAFARPVPNNTFKEFAPITGDVVRPGLVRYMAGYFGERGNANIARDKIKTMGYSDAFVVAYCDGERIPVYRAVQLIASGACVPTVKTSGSPVIAGSAAQRTGGGSFEAELDTYSYNKGANAAVADVAEAKMGLYYTVQVGVYNTPVGAAQLKNISPLITKRLPNGQIRYSSGIFNSAAEAKPKQNEAINRGITDAFITAYYQGKRISLGEAKNLIDDKGETVLELENPTISQGNKIVNRTAPDDLTEDRKPFLENKKLQSMLVSKLTFSSYPTQILNRYNADGQLFYYDSITKNIKSFVFEGSYTEHSFNDDFESKELYNAVYPVVNKDEAQRKEAIKDYDKNTVVLNVEISVRDLNPDLMRTIINAPFNKTMTTSSESIKVNFYALQTQKNEQLINHLQVLLAQFGATNISKTIRQFDEN